MQKKIFAAALIAALIGCAYFESQPEYNSEKVRAAELNAPEITTEPEPAYFIELYEDSIFIYDPETTEIIYKEHYKTNSGLAAAILKDNL